MMRSLDQLERDIDKLQQDWAAMRREANRFPGVQRAGREGAGTMTQHYEVSRPMRGFPTQRAARDIADQIAWQLADRFHDAFYPTTGFHQGEGWFAFVHNGRQGAALRGLLFTPAAAEEYLAALNCGDEVLVPNG